jgi:hypothetical protein
VLAFCEKLNDRSGATAIDLFVDDDHACPARLLPSNLARPSIFPSSSHYVSGRTEGIDSHSLRRARMELRYSSMDRVRSFYRYCSMLHDKLSC